MGPKAELGHSDLIIHASYLGQRAPTSQGRFLSKDIKGQNGLPGYGNTCNGFGS